MSAKDFLYDYSVDDLNVYGRHEEHYSLDSLMEEYAKVYHEREIKKMQLSTVLSGLSIGDITNIVNAFTDIVIPKEAVEEEIEYLNKRRK